MTDHLIGYALILFGAWVVYREVTSEDRAYRRAIEAARTIRVGLTR